MKPYWALVAMAAMAAAPAAAQVNSIESSNPGFQGGDPNRKICQRVEKTGSRLNVVQICMTALEWQQQRRDNRTDLERNQQNMHHKPVN